MKTFRIKGSSGTSTLMIGEKLANLPNHIPLQRSVIVTDSTVESLYREYFPNCDTIVLGTGEKTKTLDTVQTLYERLVSLEADRSVFIVGIGGGIVCDITGFVASTYLRGVRFGFVATTLLAQVDASVGGKNGVNYGGYKNMVGTFNQPEFVICDPDLLKTLPSPEVSCGLAEIVKHAAIADLDMFQYLEAKHPAALSLERDVVQRLVFDSIRIKSEIVNRDEKEAGERRKLNFGHTFGHAIEKTARVSHGAAVSAGMVAASALSVKRGLLRPAQAERIQNLLQHLMLPARIETDRKAVLDALRRDKKREGQRIHFVLLERIGRAVVEKIPLDELASVLP